MTTEQTIYALVGVFILGMAVGFILGEHYGIGDTMKKLDEPDQEARK